MNDVKSAINVMQKLHEEGIKISIDDFCTAYSSLAYLKQFKALLLAVYVQTVRSTAQLNTKIVGA